MERLLGVLLVAFSAVCFGSNAIFARFAYQAGTNPLTFLFFRFTLAALALIVVMALRGQSWPRGRLFITLFFLGGLGTVGTTLAFYTAITLAPISTVIVIAYMYPALVTLVTAMHLKRAVTANKWIALGMTLTGIVLTIGLELGGQALGILLSVVTALCYACYLAFGEGFFNKAGPMPATAVVTVSAAMVYALLVAMQGLQLPRLPSGWLAVVGSALFSTVIGCFSLFEGLKRIDSASCAIISTLEVIVAIAMAVLILKEPFTLMKSAGTLLVLSAVVVLAQGEYRAARPPVLKVG